MVEGYHALLHSGDIPVPVLWEMHGLVPAILIVYPSPTTFIKSPSSDTALQGTDSHGQPHEHCPVLLLLPVCPTLREMGEGAPQSPLLPYTWILY